MSTAFHHTNYGMFGGSLPTDCDGYVYLTVKEWMDAGYTRAEARERAKAAKEAVKDASEALVAWQEGN